MKRMGHFEKKTVYIECTSLQELFEIVSGELVNEQDKGWLIDHNHRNFITVGHQDVTVDDQVKEEVFTADLYLWRRLERRG